MTFLGWSPDGRYVVYRREQWERPRYPGARPRHRSRTLHREVRRAKLRGYGPPLRPDPQAYLRAHHYERRALPRRAAGPNAFVFGAPSDPHPITLRAVPGDDGLVWTLRRGSQTLATRPFDRLYVGMDAHLYPSPQGDTLAVILSLDTGWRVDSAIYLVAVAATPQTAAPETP